LPAAKRALTGIDPVAVAASVVGELAREAPEVDVDGGFPRRAVELLRQRGLLAAPVAVRRGGLGLGAAGGRGALERLLRVLAHLGRGNAAVGRIYEGHVNALLLIEAFGTAAQIDRHARDALDGHLFAVWNTQAGDGVELRPLGPDRYALSGSKTFATGAGFVSRALVTAGDGRGGWQMVVVATDGAPPAIDRSFWKPLGMRATASFKADFTGIDVAGDDLLGSPGDYYREPAFSAGAVRFAAVQLGVVEAVFDETRAFLRQLRRTDDPFQQARAGEMAALVAGARQWLSAASWQHDGPSSPEAAIAQAHLMRASIETTALRVLQLAERSVGARGLLRPAPFERLHRDLTHYLRQANADGALASAGAHVLGREEPACRLWNEGPGGAGVLSGDA